MQYTRSAGRNGLLVVGAFVIGTAVLTGLVPTPVFDRYVPRSGIDVLFVLSTAALLGVYTTQQCTRVDCSWGVSPYLGGIGGGFAASCPYCIPVIEHTLHPVVIGLYLVPVRPVVGVFSIAVLAGAIAVRQRRLVTAGPATADVNLRCPTCGVVLREATDDPEPEFVGGEMRLEVCCHSCADPLVVRVEPAVDDRFEVTKRVTRAADEDDERTEASPYSIAPGRDRE